MDGSAVASRLWHGVGVALRLLLVLAVVLAVLDPLPALAGTPDAAARPGPGYGYDAPPAATTPPANTRTGVADGYAMALHLSRLRTLVSGAVLAAKAEGDLVDLTSLAVRRHILDVEVRPNGAHVGEHWDGTGFPNKSEFPRGGPTPRSFITSLTSATDPASARSFRNGATFLRGRRDGVDFEVVMRNGEIRTGYPISARRNR